MSDDDAIAPTGEAVDARRLRVARAFSRALARADLRWSTLTRLVVHDVVEALGDAAALFLLSDDGTALDLVAADHVEPGGGRLIRAVFSTAPHRPTEGFLRPVIETGEPLLLADVDQELLRSMYSEPKHLEYFERFGVSSLVVVPLSASGTVIGALALTRDRSSPSFRPDDVDFALDLADRAALALLDMRLQARQQTTSDALREARAILGAVMGSVIDAVIVIDEVGAVVSINATSEELLGWRSDELAGRSVDVLMPDASMGSHHSYIDQHVHTRASSVVGTCREVEIRHHDGHLIPVEISVSELTVAGRRFFVGIARDIRERKRHEQALRRQATLDALTGLVNRASLHRALARSFEYVDVGGQVALLFVDLDDFKNVNDRHGHPTGDLVLREVGQRLEHAVRREDLVARYGGDEFVVVIERAQDVEADAAVVARRISDAFAEPFHIDGVIAHLSCSIGIAVAPRDAESVSRLITEADAAMYRDKARLREI